MSDSFLKNLLARLRERRADQRLSRLRESLRQQAAMEQAHVPLTEATVLELLDQFASAFANTAPDGAVIEHSMPLWHEALNTLSNAEAREAARLVIKARRQYPVPNDVLMAAETIDQVRSLRRALHDPA